MAIAAVLGLLAIAYFAKGFYYLALDPTGAKDLFLRWVEQQYIYRGYYPYDITSASPFIDPQVGAVTSGGYFPWSFFTGFFLVPPLPFPLIRLYHVLLNLGSVFILGIFAYRLGSRYSPIDGLLSLAATLAISTHATTLRNGQYGILLNALLVLILWGLQANFGKISGLLYAISLVKPNITAMYFWVLVVRRRWRAIAAMTVYVAIATAVIWGITGRDPLYMVATIFAQSETFAKFGYSGTSLLAKMGFSPQGVLVGFGLLAMAIAILLFYQFRHYSLLSQFAIAAVIGRVSTYHLIYDNVMVIFLLLAVTNMALQTQKVSHQFVFAVVGISLWVPASWTDSDAVQSLQFTIWIVALAYLLLHERKTLISYQKDESLSPQKLTRSPSISR